MCAERVYIHIYLRRKKQKSIEISTPMYLGFRIRQVYRLIGTRQSSGRNREICLPFISALIKPKLKLENFCKKPLKT